MNSTLVRNLSFEHVIKLCQFLDGDQSNNWKLLGRNIFKNDVEKIATINFMENNYTEENSPSMKMIQSLRVKKPDMTNISVLKNIALKLKRKDIALYLDSLSQSSILKISLKETYKLIYLLEKRVSGLKDWRHFADELGYTYLEIQEFEQCPIYSKNSATEKLLRFIVQNRPSMTVKLLKEALHDISRNDAAEYLRLYYYRKM